MDKKNLSSMLSIFFLLTIFIINVNMTSALKSFDPNVENFGEIKVKDWLFFSRADYKLMSYDCSVIDCWAEGEYKLYKKTHLFQNLKFKDLAGKEGTYKDYKFFIEKNKTIYSLDPTFNQTCEDIVQANGTSTSCYRTQNGTINNSRVESYWAEYSKNQDLDIGEGKWRIEVKRNPNQRTDFILQAQDYDFVEWAWWNTTWNFKQLITINFSGAANLTQHWINFTYVGQTGKFKSDFSDLRFINYNENAELVWKYTQKNSTEIWVQLFAEDGKQNISNGVIQFWAYYNVSSYVNYGWNTTFYYGDTFTNKSSVGWTNGLSGAGLYSISGNDLYLNSNASSTSSIYVNLPPTVANWSSYTINSNATWTGCQANDGSYLYLGLGQTGADPTQTMVGVFLNGRYSGYSNDNFGGAFANKLSNNTNIGVNICNNWITSEVAHTGNRNDSATTRSYTVYWQRDNYASSGSYTNTTTSYAMSNTPAMFVWGNSRWDGNDLKVNYLLLSKGTGQQIAYSVGAEQSSTLPPTITIYSPADNMNTTNTTVSFIASVSNYANINNVSLIINNIYNQTNTSGINNTNYTFTKIFADGNYSWIIESCNTNSECANSSSRTFMVDHLSPTITSPTNLTDLVTFSLPINSTWSFNATDPHLAQCFYNTTDHATTTVSCNSTIQTQWSTQGNKTITSCANDTFSFQTCQTNYIYVYYIQVVQADNPDPVGEGTEVTFNLTINMTNIPSTTAYLYLNNTPYAATTSNAGTNGYYFERSVVIPQGWGNSTGNRIDWRWVYNISGVATNQNTSLTNLTVFRMDIDDCSAYTDRILNITLKDEATNLVLNTTNANNTNIQVDLLITSLEDESLTWEYSNTWIDDADGTVYVCVPSGVLNNSEYRIDLTAGYTAEDYVQRFYYIDNGTLDNTQIITSLTNKTITFYDLLLADSTTFLFRFFDEDGLEVVDGIAHVFRQYIGDGLFREVERGKQDNNGETHLHLVEEDVIYFFKVSLDGEVIYTSATYNAKCLSSPCEIELEAASDFVGFDDNFDLVNGTYTITDDASTRDITLAYALDDPETMNLSIYKYTNDPTTMELVGSDQAYSTGGTLSVTVPQVAGNVTFVAVVYKNGEFVSSEFVDFGESGAAYFGSTGIFMALLLLICLILIAVSEGEGIIIFSVIGLIVISVLKLIDLDWYSLVGFISAALILTWKLVKRRGR